MKKSLFIILNIFSISFGYGQAVDSILNKYYSKQREPGGIILIKNDADINMSSKGLAHVEKNISISSDTRFRMASVSKQFTAMAIYLLIQDRKLSFETPIRSIFPELASSNSSIKVKHLLNHSSGILDYENVIPNSQKDQLSDSDVLKLVQPFDAVYYEAGSKFRYSNTAYCLMSLIVERLTNQHYEGFCNERIFQKLQMSSAQISAPGTFKNRAFGYKFKNSAIKFADQSITSATRGDGGVYISANDYAKWIDTANSLFSKQFYVDLEKYKIKVKDDVYYSLGLFFTYSTDGYLTLFHSGESTGFHHVFVFQPQRNYAVSLFTNRDDLVLATIFDEILKKENILFRKIQEPLFLWLNKVYNND